MSRQLRALWQTGIPVVDGALDALRKTILNRSAFVVDGWFANNLAAGAGATLMNRVGWPADAVAWSTTKWLAPRNGSVISLFLGVSAVLTVGDITVKLFRNGADSGLFVKYPVVGPLFRASYSPQGISKFLAGDYLELKYTTAGGLTPAGSVDIMAGIEIVLD